MRSIMPTLRDRVFAHAARIPIKSGTFRRHLAAFDRTLDPDFLQAAGLIRNVTDARWNVTLFSVEHNTTAREQELDRLMQRHSYERRYPGISKFDAWYRKAA